MSTLVRFLLVGASIAVLYAVLAALATTHLPWPMAVSAGVIWIACIPLGYWCQRRFTFTDSAPRPFALGLYALTQVLGICIGSGAAYLFATGRFGSDIFVHLGASGLAAILSYIINRNVTFPTRDPR